MKIILLVMFLSSISFAQMRPLPAMTVCILDEPDCHNRIEQDKRDIETKARLDKIVNDMDLLERLSLEKDKLNLYSIEISKQRIEIDNLQERYRLEKKIAGITGLMLFAVGNNDLKNIGLISLFCWSIW